MAMRVGVIAALVLGCSLAAAAGAQVPGGSSPTATRPPPVIAPAPAAPVQSRPQTAVPSTLSQRTTPPAARKAAAVPAPAAANPPAPASLQPPPYVRIYDRNGRLVPGAVQAGPGRVLDTRTGRYHDAAPGQDGLRIRP
ncbi:classical arabinogalactan protein 4 [Stenotrophomonas sp. MMGLT7]|uniref:classical arabinogalactan protein 4 n=1 Tax=Stenotrophomonas sp. MMGLT7 TaxID=2901227 RepID=UPI001E437658|nr:classical arabinogalactan protein 4 [Stenotrophomonas sp. MMGLT7]MCD7099287.1 classical arabinogalactan protein 4 [Stenotrophomonas sp. MMGLT7]